MFHWIASKESLTPKIRRENNQNHAWNKTRKKKVNMYPGEGEPASHEGNRLDFYCRGSAIHKVCFSLSRDNNLCLRERERESEREREWGRERESNYSRRGRCITADATHNWHFLVAPWCKHFPNRWWWHLKHSKSVIPHNLKIVIYNRNCKLMDTEK